MTINSQAVTSPLDAVMEAALRAARDEKQRYARKRQTNIPTTLAAYRGLDLVALVVPDVIQRDVMLATAHMMAIGFGPDLLSCIFEAWHTELRENPMTGRGWEPGEMQALAEERDGRAKGWVTDSLMVHVCNRAGDKAASVLPYSITGGRLTWIKSPACGERDFTGLVPETLAAAMAAPTIDVMMARRGASAANYGLNPEEARAHADCATARLLTARRCSVAMGVERGSQRERIIRRSLPGGRVIDRARRSES